MQQLGALKITGKEGRWRCQEINGHQAEVACPPNLQHMLDANYDDQLANTANARCGLDGRCYPDVEGTSQESCQQTCRSVENRDVLASVILPYNPAQGITLPPHERIQLVRKITGATLPARQSAIALKALEEDDWATLRALPALLPYLQSLYDPLVIYIRDVLSLLPIGLGLPVDYERLVSRFKEWIGTHLPRLSELERLLLEDLDNGDLQDEFYETRSRVTWTVITQLVGEEYTPSDDDFELITNTIFSLLTDDLIAALTQ